MHLTVWLRSVCGSAPCMTMSERAGCDRMCLDPGGGARNLSLWNVDGGTHTGAQFRAWSHGSYVHLILLTRGFLSNYRRGSTVLSLWIYDGRGGRGFLL